MASVRLRRFEIEEKLLPDVCVTCGAEAVVHRRKTFTWQPPWVIVIIILSLLPGLIVALVLTKRMRIYAPFCEAHRNYWTWRAWYTWLGLTLVIFFVSAAAFLMAAVSKGPPPQQSFALMVLIGTILSGVVWLISAAVIQSISIRPTEITNKDIRLTNVSPYFQEAVEAMREGWQSPQMPQRYLASLDDDFGEADWDRGRE